MTNDEKLKEIGKTVLTTLFNNDITNPEWEYFSAVCYGQRVCEYGGLPVHGFFDLAELDKAQYDEKFAAKYPEKTDVEVWTETIKPELEYCANKITDKTADIMAIVNIM